MPDPDPSYPLTPLVCDGCPRCLSGCPECDEAAEEKKDREILLRKAEYDASHGDYWAQKCVDLMNGKI